MAAAALCHVSTIHYHHRFQRTATTNFISRCRPVEVRSAPSVRYTILPQSIGTNSNLSPSFATSQSSDTSSSPPSPSSSYLQNSLTPGRFLTPEETEKLQLLENFTYSTELDSGSLCIRVMRPQELDITVALLSESFAESMLLPTGYVKYLGFLVKQYMNERRSLIPHTITLVGYYRGIDGSEEEDGELAATVELSFDQRGANASPPTPTPPKNSPYICNMSVKKQLRRRGIGWHILKASEELISQMSLSREVYLHCRMIDSAPFSMYEKSGYDVVKTDSIFILLTLQRRKHLMRKILPIVSGTSDLSSLESQ